MSSPVSPSTSTQRPPFETDEWTRTPVLDRITDQIMELVDRDRSEKPLSELVARIITNQKFTEKDLNLYLSRYSSIVVRMPRTQFTLSHLAGLTGNIKLAALLAKRGEFSNSPIYNGAAPCHLAALRGHLDFLKHAETFGGDLKQRSIVNLTPIDVFEIIYPHLAKYCPYSSVPKSIRFFETDGPMRFTSPNEDFGFTYTDHICLNAATVENDLIRKPEKIHSFPASKTGLHPSLALIRLNSLYPSCRSDLGLGVIAIAHIRTNEFLGRYSGVLWHSKGAGNHSLDSPYSPSFLTHMRKKVSDARIDAIFAGNLLSRFGDGIPNVRGTIDEHGLYGLKALERIPSGSLLLWNYGPNHPVKLGSYIYFDEPRLNQFIKYLPAHIADMNKIPLSKIHLEFQKKRNKAVIEKLDYIFSTPQLLWEVFLTNRLDIKIFNGEFLTRMNRTAKISELEYIIEKIALLYVVLSRVQTVEKREILLKHLKDLSHESFKEAESFLDNCDTTLPPSVYHMSAEEFTRALTIE